MTAHLQGMPGPGDATPPDEPGRAPERSGGLRALPIRRLTGFLGLPLISAIAPFLVLPVLLSQVGTQAWAAIAIGQSVGTGASAVVLLGWPVIGPTLVAEDPGRQHRLFADSVVSRLTVLAVAAPVAMLLAGVLAPGGQRPTALLMALASALLGLSPSWFFIGTGRPGAIARWDTVPRVGATGVAAFLVGLVPWAWLYPAVLAVTSAVLVVAVSARYGERGPIRPLRTTATVVRQQWAAASVSGQAALTATLPMALLATVAPGAVAGFAAIDRVARLTTFVLTPVGQAFQGWVSEPSPDRPRRRRTALLVTVAAGVLLATAFLIGADELLRVLFAAKIEVPYLAVVCEAGAIVGVSLGLTLGFHHLVPLRLSNWLALSTAVGIVVASTGMVLLAPRFGVAGGALSILLAETGVVLTQAIGLTRNRRRRRAPAE